MDGLPSSPCQAGSLPRGIASWFPSRRDGEVPITVRDIAASQRGEPDAYVHVPFCEGLCPFCRYSEELRRPTGEAPRRETNNGHAHL